MKLAHPSLLAALAMVLLEARGFKKDDFATFHPGGNLGRTLLLKVEEVMRPMDQMVILPGTASVNETLALLAKKRAGAAAVVDGKGRLQGIYTHGDFTRGYQANVAAISAVKDMIARSIDLFR